jgi:hypothetical protein
MQVTVLCVKFLGQNEFSRKTGRRPQLAACQWGQGGRQPNTKTVGSGAIHGPIFKWALLVRLPDADLISIGSVCLTWMSRIRCAAAAADVADVQGRTRRQGRRLSVAHRLVRVNVTSVAHAA